MKIDYISTDDTLDKHRILCRTNGTNFEISGSGESQMHLYNSINWTYVDSRFPIGYLFIMTDNVGVIEYRTLNSTVNVAISTVFYLNQNDTINP